MRAVCRLRSQRADSECIRLLTLVSIFRTSVVLLIPPFVSHELVQSCRSRVLVKEWKGQAAEGRLSIVSLTAAAKYCECVLKDG